MKRIVNVCARVLVWVLIITMPILAILFACGYNINVVHGNSMYPTLCDWDIVITEKKFTPERNDIIVLDTEDGYNLIKRVIGMPGETVQIINGYIFINGTQFQDCVDIQITDAGLFAEPVTIPADHYFVLGDNRNNSNDSRALGPISADNIFGRVIRHFSKGEVTLKSIKGVQPSET